MMETNEHRAMLRGIRAELKDMREMLEELLAKRREAPDARLTGDWKDPHAVR